MPQDQQPERSIRQILTRRRLLSLTGVGVVGALAGCGGDEGTTESDTPETTGTATETATETSTETSTETATGTPTQTATETPTETETETPTQTETVQTPDDVDADVIVDAGGKGDFETVGAAIDSLPDGGDEETVVFITSGTYKEKLELPESKSNVTFLGDGPEETILTYDDHANKTDENGEELGTEGSASVSVRADDFTARDLTFRNTVAPAPQAVALLVDGDRAVFENCRFVGAQDTLYTYGEQTRQYYHDCYIEGRTDFVFGAATAWFQNCSIACTGGGNVTAAKTPEDVEHGYIFENCEITGELTMGVYLGRPWGPQAKTLFRGCHLGETINPSGWNEWDGREETCWFAEYDNEGPGYTPEERVPWANILDDEEAAAYTYENVFSEWNPRGRLRDA